MKKQMILAAWGLLTAIVPAGAQTVYDAANLTGKDLNGTARFVGMGGAMGALGGDISTIATNPAGIGIYRSNDASISFGFSGYGTESDYVGTTMSSDKRKGQFDNAGFVLSYKVGNATPLRYFNFGFNYKRVKSFYKNMSMGGNLGDYTQTDYMAAQAEGLTKWNGNIYNNAEIGWLSALGYDGYLITDLIAVPDGTDVPSGYEPYTVNGTQATNLNGDLMYTTPGEYGGMYWGGTGTFRSQERGGIDEYDFNLSFNIKDRFYFGMTVGAYQVTYKKYTYYDEDYGNGEGYTLQGWNRIDGNGVDVKLGAIIRPFEYSPLRIGLAVHSPIFYHLDYKTSAYLASDVLNDLEVTNEAGVPSGEIGRYDIDTYDILKGDMVRSFQLRTPWTYNLSLGYTIGKNLALGAEYEYQNYAKMKFMDDEGYSDTFRYENSTTDMLKGVSTLRLGAEYKPTPQIAFRAGYNRTSAKFHNDAYKDLPYNSIQTDTDFANVKGLNNYTLGIGFRGQVFYADVAYKYTTYKEDFYPFIDVYQEGNAWIVDSPQVTHVKNDRHQLLLTVGVHF
ncbi:MAG: TonB-dependent receptor [Prevotellaceae bacterium]|nr:TonB-dependent receptor [Prevotellaceae bacterium]